jgi:hypothetical protein
MKGVVASLAVATTVAASAFAQVSGQVNAPAARPTADPLAVTPISPSQAEARDADRIRTKIEQAGYTEVVDLSRDSTGVWHARARKGGDVIGLTVDKGGRIKPAPR